MKTPEELAEEFVNQEDTGSDTFAHGLRNGFLAGFELAKRQYAKQLKQAYLNGEINSFIRKLNDMQEITAPEHDLAEEYGKKLERNGKFIVYSDSLREAKKGFIAGYQAAAPQWIPVEESLPEIGDLILIYGNGSNLGAPFVSVGFLDNHPDHWVAEKQWNIWERNQYDHLMLDIGKKITHWMPLPKPPEE